MSGENTNSPATTAPEATGPVPELPDVKFEGTELVFVNRPADAEYYNELWLAAEDSTGDLINDSIWRRNTYIEEKIRGYHQHRGIFFSRRSRLDGVDVQ